MKRLCCDPPFSASSKGRACPPADSSPRSNLHEIINRIRPECICTCYPNLRYLEASYIPFVFDLTCHAVSGICISIHRLPEWGRALRGCIMQVSINSSTRSLDSGKSSYPKEGMKSLSRVLLGGCFNVFVRLLRWGIVPTSEHLGLNFNFRLRLQERDAENPPIHLR